MAPTRQRRKAASRENKWVRAERSDTTQTPVKRTDKPMELRLKKETRNTSESKAKGERC